MAFLIKNLLPLQMTTYYSGIVRKRGSLKSFDAIARLLIGVIKRYCSEETLIQSRRLNQNMLNSEIELSKYNTDTSFRNYKDTVIKQSIWIFKGYFLNEIYEYQNDVINGGSKKNIKFIDKIQQDISSN